MSPATTSVPADEQRWPRYLDDLRAYASMRVPLKTQGSLVRVTGLVLEAAGVRAPVGSVFKPAGSHSK